MNILVAFSGGRTSAYMSYMYKKYNKNDNLLFLFANTGEEHPKTLEFVDRCDKEFGLNLVWVESKVNYGRNASSHDITDFNSASRNGRPFSDVIKKYGIPNKSYPHCNRELKLNPAHSYAREYFGGRDYFNAVGIRIDEPSRLYSKNMESYCNGAIYPLADTWPVDKQDVMDFWEDMPFDLDIPEHYGNCKTCWKKSDRKLFTIITEHPEWFDFNRKMEREHSTDGANAIERPRVFFRSNRSTDDMFAQCKAVNFKRFKEERNTQQKLFGYDIDENSGCTEECNGF